MEHINRLLWHMKTNKVLLFRQLNKYISLKEAFKKMNKLGREHRLVYRSLAPSYL